MSRVRSPKAASTDVHDACLNVIEASQADHRFCFFGPVEAFRPFLDTEFGCGGCAARKEAFIGKRVLVRHRFRRSRNSSSGGSIIVEPSVLIDEAGERLAGGNGSGANAFQLLYELVQ